MDFFEAQAAAHRTTLRLIGLFIAAVAAMIVLTVLVVAAAIAWSQPPSGYVDAHKLAQALSPTLVLGIGGAVIGVVVVASAFRLMALSGGGRAVAESLDARLVQPNTDDPAERRLLNVVEEMAIAAGLPVPPVYVIRETGINAFAAGYGPDDAVLGITEGALVRLNREELQGVVGHEFSHVLNGDMRMNIRLMSVLFGILVIGIIGRSLIGTRRTRISTGSRSSSSKGGAAQIAMIGLGLLVIGYVGTFFGNLIKAAVSRQREFLADASSVQFTRNPDGIAGALKKIGGTDGGSRIADAHADEMSHMFFSQSFRSLFGLGGLLATHPPLEQRIRAVEPGWNGRFVRATVAEPAQDEAEAEPGAQRSDAPAAAPPFDALHVVDDVAGPTGALPAAVATGLGAAVAGATLGQVEPASVDRAHALIDGIPAALRSAAHDPFGARAAMYVLLLSDDDAVRSRQLDHIDREAEPGVPELVRELLAAAQHLPHASRLPLTHLAVPALKTLAPRQYERFKGNLVALIRADARLSRFEWVLHQVLTKELRAHFGGASRRRGPGRALRDERAACATLLSAIARTGHADEQARIEAWSAGWQALGLFGPEPDHDAGEDPNQQRLNEAMRRLRDLAPLAKPKLIKACIATAAHDGLLLDDERDLLQGVAAALDCPLPPLPDTGA